MNPETTTQRPTEVTVGAWTLMVTGVFAVVGALDSLSGINSIALRDRLTEALSTGSGEQLGVTVAQARSILEVVFIVTAIGAAIAAVFGFFVLRKDKSARIGASIVAVPVLVAAPITESLSALMVGVGATMLWSGPARDWFAGRPIRPRPNRFSRAEPGKPAEPASRSGAGAPAEVPSEPAPPVPVVTVPAPGAMPPPDGAPLPPPTAGWGTPDLATAPPAWGAPPAWNPPAPQEARPRQVGLACQLSWIFGGLTAFGSALVFLVFAANGTAAVELMQDSPGWSDRFDPEQMRTLILVGSGLTLLVSTAGIVAAVFAWNRSRLGAAILLTCVGVGVLLGILALPISLAHLVALGFSLRALVSEPSRRWFAGTNGPGAAGPGV